MGRKGISIRNGRRAKLFDFPDLMYTLLYDSSRESDAKGWKYDHRREWKILEVMSYMSPHGIRYHVWGHGKKYIKKKS